MNDECENCGDSGVDPKTKETCQECCPHDEHDHGICLECGKDIFDDLVARADFLRDCAEDR